MIIFFNTNQTILREKKKFTYKKTKIFDEKMLELFFYGRGACVAHPPGLRQWTPHAFGLMPLVGTGVRSTASQQTSEHFFSL